MPIITLQREQDPHFSIRQAPAETSTWSLAQYTQIQTGIGQSANSFPRTFRSVFEGPKEKRKRVKEEKRKKRDQRSDGEERQDLFDESEEEARPQEESEMEVEERTVTVDVDSDQEYEELAKSMEQNSKINRYAGPKTTLGM